MTLLLKRSAILFSMGASSLKANMLLYIFLFSSTYSIWSSGVSLFLTLNRSRQASSPHLFISVLSFFKYSSVISFFSSSFSLPCCEWWSLSCSSRHSFVLQYMHRDHCGILRFCTSADHSFKFGSFCWNCFLLVLV